LIFVTGWLLFTLEARAQIPFPFPQAGSPPPQIGQPSQPEFPPLSEVTKDFEPRRGFINLYVSMKKQRILGEIPGQLLQRPFLLATSIAGGYFAGWQWDDRMVYWERLDRKLLLVEPELRYRAQGSTLAEVVRRTYRDTVITSVPILAEGPGGSVLIDLTGLFADKCFIFVGSLGNGVDASLTKIAKAKVFPKNAEVELDLVSSRGRSSRLSFFGGGGSSGSLSVHYSISELPAGGVRPRTGDGPFTPSEPPGTPYHPRQADDRIGYFLTAHKDFSKSPRDETRFVRYINRWHLEKADPSLEVSPPKEPIVFYVEKTVPIRFRRYVHEGILEWNKAFEKIGIVGAIVVRQQTDTEFGDLDPEDIRYNFFRWIASESPFAMGPSRVNPETGQILDADIIFDDAMIRDWLEDYARLIEKGPMKEFHPSVQRWLEENPNRHPMRRWMAKSEPLDAAKNLSRGEPDRASLRGPASPEDFGLGDIPVESLPKSLRRVGSCDFGSGIRHQVNFGLMAFSILADRPPQPGEFAGKDQWPEDFIGQVLREVVMHEVGHTLGLRHNFKASAWRSLDEINSKDSPPDALTGSVMDYNPINISPEGKPQGYWSTRTIGPYDYWAIEYGYTLKNDPKELEKIASRAAEKGLDYATDEDTWASDPLVNRFDLGNDPLEYTRRRMKLMQEMMQNLTARVVQPGQGYQRVRQAFDMLLYDYGRSALQAARVVGGHYLHRDHKGDPNERPPLEPVPASKQRESLDLVCDKVFGDKAFFFSPELLNHLAAGRWYHWGSEDEMEDVEYPIHDRILQLQLWTLFRFLNPRTLTLLSDAEARIGQESDAITFPELFGKITDAIWAEVKKPLETGEYTNRKPMISSIRRNLQHEHLGEMIDLALEDDSGPSPQAARTQAYYHLKKLGMEVDKLLASNQGPGSLDDYSRAHLEETSRRIAKVLEAVYSRNPSSGGSGTIIFLGRPAAEGER
jgi:hypothetical protein